MVMNVIPKSKPKQKDDCDDEDIKRNAEKYVNSKVGPENDIGASSDRVRQDYDVLDPNSAVRISSHALAFVERIKNQVYQVVALLRCMFLISFSPALAIAPRCTAPDPFQQRT